ncbi:DgyrCDS14205 [Dimorphilus gyrociliatus]|uniref:DgyrCDS14205 n=1 Tax=Dimorphilus gyrociliatus TaxID=2664684 RepID=A0A7I8WCW7_9ANNE|nr:DgyrCDS14205 [Dimorphilus gyrociliatus]
METDNVVEIDTDADMYPITKNAEYLQDERLIKTSFGDLPSIPSSCRIRKKKRRTYTLGERKAIIKYIEDEGMVSARRKFKFQRSQLSSWSAKDVSNLSGSFQQCQPKLNSHLPYSNYVEEALTAFITSGRKKTIYELEEQALRLVATQVRKSGAGIRLMNHVLRRISGKITEDVNVLLDNSNKPLANFYSTRRPLGVRQKTCQGSVISRYYGMTSPIL